MSDALEQLEENLLPEVGKVVAMVIYGLDRRVLAIKRPDNEEWEPGKYSPPVGHVEETDIKNLLFCKDHDILNGNKYDLYYLAGQRELGEEVGRTPSQVSLKYIGQYSDHETGLNVIVLGGYMVSGPKRPSLYPSAEASEAKWFTPQRVRKLAERGRLVGIKAYEMAFSNPLIQGAATGVSYLAKRSK